MTKDEKKVDESFPDEANLFLEIDEEDLRNVAGAEIERLEAEQSSDGHLSWGADLKDLLSGALVKAVALKLDRATPRNFTLDEVNVKFDLKGQPFGVGIGGSVSAKFKRNLS